MKTYFLTGGEGFVGYFICKKLLEDPNNKIITYDAQKHYVQWEKSKWPVFQSYRLNELDKYGDRIIRIKGDVTDRGLLKESIDKYKPNIIIHLAALPTANISNDYPEEAKRNILETTLTLLDVLREAKFEFEKIIYTSSSMVYGDFLRDKEGNILPALEDQQCSPVGLYGAMKLSGEYILKAYSKRFGFTYTIIRPSAVYGPTDANRRVTEIFVNNALDGKELRLDNGGLHQLDFTYVKDLADGFILAANSQKANNQTFNLTAGDGRTIKEMAEVISQIVPDTKTTVKEVKVYRPNRGTLSIEKAKKLLGYSPKYKLEQGMKEYIDFLKEFKNGK